MEPIHSKPFKPCVTLGQMFGFDSARPETRTPSPFVNAFLEAFHTLKTRHADAIAEYMGLTRTELSTVLRVETGYSFVDFRDHYAIMLTQRCREERQRKKFEIRQQVAKARQVRHQLTDEEIAREVGYADRVGLWRLRKTKRYREILAEQQRLGLLSDNQTPDIQ